MFICCCRGIVMLRFYLLEFYWIRSNIFLFLDVMIRYSLNWELLVIGVMSFHLHLSDDEKTLLTVF